MHTSEDLPKVVIEAIRAQGHRALVSRGWAGLALINDADDCFVVGEANHQALFGRAGRRRAPRRRGHHDHGRPGRTRPRVVVPRGDVEISRTGPAGWPTWASARHDAGPHADLRFPVGCCSGRP
ncbi:hypothetical protein [Streptomyces purpurascens]